MLIGKVSCFHAVWPSPYPCCTIQFAPTGLRPHSYQNKPHLKLTVHAPGVLQPILCETLCQRGALGSNVIKSFSQHQNLVCWRPGAQQHSQGANLCVMPGQTHTGNRHKHFLLGSRGSRGKRRSLLPPSMSDLALFN